MSRRLDQAQVITRGKPARGAVRGRPAWAGTGGGGSVVSLIGVDNDQPENHNTTTVSVDMPSGVAAGDLIVFALGNVVGTSPTWGFPAGFLDDYDLVASVAGTSSAWGEFRTYYRIADGSESGTFTFTMSAGGGITATVAVLRLVAATVPFYVSMTNYNDNNHDKAPGMPFMFPRRNIELYHHNRRFSSSGSNPAVTLSGDPDVDLGSREGSGVASGIGLFVHPPTVARDRAGFNSNATRTRLFSIVVSSESEGLAFAFDEAALDGPNIFEDTYNANVDWEFAEEDGERYLECTTGSVNALRSIRWRIWSPNKSAGFSEVLARVRKKSSGSGCYVWAKFNGNASSNRTGVFLSNTGNATLRADGDTTLATGLSDDTWYWVRVQDDGDGNARARFWADGDAEPAGWTAEETAETSGDNWHPGLGSWSNQRSQFSYLSTSHDPAVSAPAPLS